MGFDNAYFTAMAYGGRAGTSIWHYYDVNGDNLASLVMGKINAGYFSLAYTTHGIKGRLGDIIFVSGPMYAASGVNSATPAMCTFCVVDDWDSNGASVMKMGGFHVFA